MTITGRPMRAGGTNVGFAEARAATDVAEAAQQFQAARTVADHSLDVSDCRELLSMLGLSARSADTPTPARQERPVNRTHRDAQGAYRPTEGARR
ncbi:hypothetical protein ACFFSW_27050 [Saccharothrix longispora]|uniref:Uncharacterized protein n=1 Tax=Saccharothrix longispora TaxID=33920 RepID=A0ABU1Q1I2_9PSEU|nr:hypothetical protein [Saccharothrix longispora]MDR6596383.1 hypothetical protein [Saccharothrix longispora]